MAKWYNAYLTDDEQKHKQISSKGITARRRKNQASSISKSYSTEADNDTQRILEDAFKKKGGSSK